MDGVELTQMMSKAMESIKSMLDIDSVVGKPVYSADNSTIIPICKTSVGFFTAGGEIDGKYNRVRTDDLPIGGIGGGLTITPLAFLVVQDGDSRLIKVQGDGVDRWMEILQSTINTLKKDE